jgi:hypothetical protein
MLADNQHRLTDPVAHFVSRFAIFFQLKSFRIEAFGSTDISCGYCHDLNRSEAKGGTFHSSSTFMPIGRW